MESKKDIYNLWIQYTTKNDEQFFRQFISGFVQIWEEQLNINFDNPPACNAIKSDCGPHLSRLPDELLPAIGKFLIIAKDNVQNQEKVVAAAQLNESTLLVKCLTVMCRHFDNIATIANYEYISSVIAIAVNVVQAIFATSSQQTKDAIEYIQSFCHLIEVIYDPYLTWRNFLIGNDTGGCYSGGKKNNGVSIPLHVELVPFIYDCFQSDTILSHTEVATNLLHLLGSCISGSQNSLNATHVVGLSTVHRRVSVTPDGATETASSQNGKRAVCPATVAVLIDVLSKWECNRTIRELALKCFALMAIVLQRTSPEERQIELVTICQLYLDAVQTLLRTKHFQTKSFDDQFEISASTTDAEQYVDTGAIVSSIAVVEHLLSEVHSSRQLCETLMEVQFIAALCGIPGKLKGWNIDLQAIASATIRSLFVLSQASGDVVATLTASDRLDRLLADIKSLGRPTQPLLDQCLQLAFDQQRQQIVYPKVLVNLIEWCGDLLDADQLFLCERLSHICCLNLCCKNVLANEHVIRAICHTLQLATLTPTCVAHLIRLIEELGKFSISPPELKQLFYLLRTEQPHFAHRRQLLQSIASIALHSLTASTVCTEFLDIQSAADGITVPDIRRWTTSGSYGFIFHAWLRLDDIAATVRTADMEENRHYRRVIVNLLSAAGSGYEVFIDRHGRLVVGIVTRKEYLTTTVATPMLCDKRWHLLTVAVVPPKRPFSYTQISVLIDGNQRLGATVKFHAFNEPFAYCTIGVAAHGHVTTTPRTDEPTEAKSSQDSLPRGMFPSLLMEKKSFLPNIVSQVPSYFTLPLRNATSSDPNVKCYPIGMQDSVFGKPLSLKGQLGCVLLADPMTNIKTLIDAGVNFASLVSQDIEPYDLTAKFVFCYSPSSCHDGLCLDLCPGDKFNGHVIAKYCRTIKIQEAINSIGGIATLLPILDTIRQTADNDMLLLDALSSNSPGDEGKATPSIDELADFEIIASTTYAEWKMIQNPAACFFCLIRYFCGGFKLFEEQLLKCDGIAQMCALLAKCSARMIDVNVLMAVHLLLESVQNQMPAPNMEFLECWYAELIFNFKIWSRTDFQITIGHVQYISTMIKDDRKYFRKRYGVQFYLDTIRLYYAKPESMSESDGKAVRLSLLEIVKYYIQKELNIKEVGIIVSYMASVKYDYLVVEMLDLLQSCMAAKNCKDQIFLLLHEPHTAELLYAVLADKQSTETLRECVLRFFGTLLYTQRVHKKHKLALRLYEASVASQSLCPGLVTHLSPLDAKSISVVLLLDQQLFDDSESGYCGALHLLWNLSTADISLKLEVLNKMLTATFNKPQSAVLIAKQVGWQDSIARLLIKNTINSCGSDENSLDESPEFLSQMDLMTFDDAAMELTGLLPDDNRDNNVLLNEIQASVTEAANVIEHEIKEIAETVTGKVAGNISSVYSIIRQTTHDIQDTFESLTHGSVDSRLKSFSTLSTQSSNSTSDENLSIKSNTTVANTIADKSSVSSSTLDACITAAELSNRSHQPKRLPSPAPSDHDQEEQLVYLVTNILFTVLWRGVDNVGGDSWRERGQVIACINMLALNNQLYCSHLTLRLRILEMGIQACLIDLAESDAASLHHQQNAAQLLRLVYDLVVLDPNEDEFKKCSTKLLNGVLVLLDALMVFQQTGIDDWIEMTRLCLGLLLKCSHHPNPDIVAMATAKLHDILQNRASPEPKELGYLMFSINKALNTAIEVGNPDQYSFLMPVMKALLDKSRTVLLLNINVPDLPPTSSGPVFFHDFQMYSGSKQWKSFIDKRIKALHTAYQDDVEKTLWEPLNIFWAECYEASKIALQKRNKQTMESRRKFQQKILIPWRMRQSEEVTRLNGFALANKTRDNQIERRWKSTKRFLYGDRGAWCRGTPKENYWRLSNNENTARMRLKLELSLYHNPHTAAAHLRDNTAIPSETTPSRLSAELGSTITPAVIRDILTEDEVVLLEEEMRATIEPQHQEMPIEKIVIAQECDLISMMTKVRGRLEVTSRIFNFIDLSSATAGDDGVRHNFRFPMSQIKEVHLRKYNLRRSALEVFLVDQTSYFINFTTKVRNKVFTKILSLQPPNIQYGSGRSPSELLKASGLTEKWVNREISNFEYLMHLNTIAGRSYNDLSQYPVFPWILADYSSEVLDLTDPRSFRDLSKPIGVVNPKNEAEVRAKFEGFEDTVGGIPKFHYGTHYSNSAGVLHYMLRVEPFTSLHIELQSGRFDVADRQFHSIPQTFKLLMDNPNDVKELIPEFFYFPEFLKNMNKFDLGTLQLTKERVNDVVLPPWARTPEDFIAIHRRALESEHVSQNINHWIDLIFGYKQKGPKAVEALNVFYYCSYEGAVDLDKISNLVEREAVEGMINNFGQTPSQLLREPHPRRLTQEETLHKLLKFELKRPDVTAFLERIVHINCELSTDKDPIIFLSTPRSPPRSFLQINPDVLVSISKVGILGCNSWVAQDRDRGFVLEVDATTSNLKNRKRLSGPFHPAIQLHSQLFAVSLDGRHLYAGGIWDSSLKVYSVGRGKTVASIIRHLDIITCIALDNCGSYIVTGSKDCTCIIWSLLANGSATGGSGTASAATVNTANNAHLMTASPTPAKHGQVNTNNSLTPKPLHTLYGHDDTVACVAIMTELDVVVSGSLDGSVNVYTIKEGQFVITLKPLGCTGSQIAISYIALSYQGHIAFSAMDDTSHSVHVYSINGVHLGSKYVSGRVTGLTTASDFLVVVDDAGDVTMSRLYGLKPVFDIPLHIPIQTVAVAPGNTHILAPLRDGRLAVIGLSVPAANTKHSVLIV